ncbi:MAG: hypothetical protein ABL940_05300 [Bacteroidia bacterium]
MVHKSKLQCTIAFVLVLFFTWSLSGVEAQAQNNVGIGTTTPNPKAILELNANDKGFLAPRMNTTFMNAIAPTATENALLIYNTDSACYHFYNGVAWKNLCQKGIDTAVINKAIKNYLGGVTFTTVINNMLVDSSVTNYATINNAIVNNITIDSSVINYTTINNATINNLTVDSSSINFTTINNAVVNNITIDSSVINYTTINNATINNLTVDSSYTNVSNSNISNINIANIDTSITNVATISVANISVLKVDSSVTNYSNINNALIDSSITNYSQVTHLQGGWGSMDSLQIGGQNIMQTMNDSVKSLAWLKKGNAGTNASTNFIGTTDAQDLVFKTNSIENMRILNTNGNVGIGTLVPNVKLEVRGSIIAANTDYVNGSTGSFLQIQQGAASGNTYSVIEAYNAGGTLFDNLILQKTLGNVGIGTPTPTKKLNIAYSNPTNYFNTDIAGSEGLMIHNTSTVDSSMATLFFQSSTIGGAQAGITGQGINGDKMDLLFWNEDGGARTRHMIIKNNGNVGIDNNNPFRKFQIGSDITGIGFDDLPASPDAGIFRFGDNTGWKLHFGRAKEAVLAPYNTGVVGSILTIVDTGNVGIGTIAPTARLEVNSGITATSGLKLTQLSGLNSTSTSNYPTVLYSGIEMEPGNFAFVYDRTNTVFYITTASGKTIKRSTGAFAFTTLTSSLPTYGVSCAALDAAGNMYMRNNDDAGTSVNNRVIKITPANVITYIGSGIQSGSALAVDAVGDIYFNGNYYDPRIWKMTPGGVVTLFNADLENYSDLQFDNSGILYACGGGIIYKFTAGGVRSVFASNVSGVQSIKFDGTGQLYAGSNLGTIYKVSALGVPTVYVAGVGNVTQMDFDVAGNLMFADYNSGILYTISNVTLASTTVLSIDNAGNVIPSSSNGISNSNNVYNNIPGSLTVNGKLYVEEDKTMNPYSNEHVVNITNTAIDLGTQMIPYLAKYKTIRFRLPANSTFTWNVPIDIAAFQVVSIQGTGNSNLTNITSQINMTANRVYSYGGISYKDVNRARIGHFAYFSINGVFINHTHNDVLPIGTGGIPALFYMSGNSPTIFFSASIINSAEHIATGSDVVNASVLTSYVNFTKNAGAPTDIQFIYTPGHPWAHANTQRFIMYRYPGTGTTLGAGVLLDTVSGKIVMM